VGKLPFGAFLLSRGGRCIRGLFRAGGTLFWRHGGGGQLSTNPPTPGAFLAEVLQNVARKFFLRHVNILTRFWVAVQPKMLDSLWGLR